MRRKGVVGQRKMRKGVSLCAGAVLLSLGIVCLMGAYLYHSPRRFGTVDERALLQIPVEAIPEDALYITAERKQYADRSMRLIIPAISLDTEIGHSTDPDVLEKKPGLYEFAQLPGTGDVNVSVAGHRDIYGQEFYSLDKLEEGHSLYLVYDGLIYQYNYLDSKVVEPTNWEVIKPQGFSCLTLTTCDPIGTTRNRLVLRAALNEITAYSDEYTYQ